jgi:hypothetical protein
MVPWFKQFILWLIFLGLLAFAAEHGTKGGLRGLWRRVLGTPDPGRPLDPEEALRRYGFYLTESARQAGIDFTHEAPTLDEKLAHIMPIIASMGASVSVVDFDRDGWLDVYVVTSKEGGKNRLYRNMGDGTFKDVAVELGVADLNRPGTGVCMGAVWGDFDNDGYEDLLVFKWGKPLLLRNVGGKRFEDVSDKAGLPKWLNAGAAVWLDYDRDGHLDLFLAGYWRDDLNLWDLKTTEIMPDSFEYAKNGGRKYLLRNRGDGTFEDVTEKVGITSTRWTLAVAAADLCGTGYPDLVLANDYGVSEFYANKAGKRFVEVGGETRIGQTPKSGMNVSFGDIFNDGRLAIYVSNITEPGNLVQGNNLWVREGTTPTGHPSYLNQATTLRVERGGWSWGAQFGDLNNDGHLDLYLANGYISANPARSYWYDYGLISSSTFKGIIRDARNWPPIRDQSLSGFQQKCLWLNRGGGEFVDVAVPAGAADTFDARSVALADLGNRGVLDLLVANQKGPLLLYRNTVAPGRGWIQFALEGGWSKADPTASNRSAIGAEVRLFWTDAAGRAYEQVQVVEGGNGYAAQNMRRLHFGLGKGATIQKAVIHWPSGRSKNLTAPEAGKIHRLKEPAK